MFTRAAFFKWPPVYVLCISVPLKKFSQQIGQEQLVRRPYRRETLERFVRAFCSPFLDRTW